MLSFELKTHSKPNFWHFARFCFLPIIYSKGQISCVGSKRLHLLWKIRGHSETRHNVPGLSLSRSRFFQFSFNFLTLFHFQRLYPMTVIVFSRQCYLKKKEGENGSLIQASTSIYHVHIYWPLRLFFAYWYRNYGSKISSAYTNNSIWNDLRFYSHLFVIIALLIHRQHFSMVYFFHCNVRFLSQFSSRYVQGYVVIWAFSDLQKDFRFRRIRNLFLFRVVPCYCL